MKTHQVANHSSNSGKHDLDHVNHVITVNHVICAQSKLAKILHVPNHSRCVMRADATVV